MLCSNTKKGGDLGDLERIGAARGDVIVATSETVEVVNQFQAHLLWMGDEDLIVGRNYLMKLHTCQVKAKVTRIKHRLDVDNGNRLATLTLALDDFGTVNIATERQGQRGQSVAVVDI